MGSEMSDHVELNAPVARVVREIFGSVASLAVVGPLREVGVEAAFARLDEIDARLSPYRIDSEVSRIRDGALAPAEAHPETRWILAACEALREESGGLFDARIAGVDGRLDPSGYVKGWAIGEAHRILIAAGMENCAFGIGGDVAASGEGPGGAGWVVGIADPRAPDGAIFARIELSDSTFSTSGDYERAFVKNGVRYHHILDPATGQPGRLCRSVTILAPQGVMAEGLSKGVFLLGPEEGLKLVAQAGAQAIIVDAANQVHMSEGLKGKVEIVHPPTEGI